MRKMAVNGVFVVKIEKITPLTGVFLIDGELQQHPSSEPDGVPGDRWRAVEAILHFVFFSNLFGLDEAV